ncbi:fatty acid-binding protein, muscle [Cimex lectularius]|uniref:Fatty acid-binding protein, muscle n=2 Tax=Cimex lectularius TaxID=79782 RepID=A0A8I6R951_CIMLE|nr:fatty acid-binding protein, muscle [Cimex lectularius]
MNKFSGLKYKLAKSEKFDEYMKALGVGLMTRTVGNSVSPVVELLVEGDEYTLKSSSTFKNTVVKFKLNQEFDQETPDGRKVKATFTMEGDNKLVEVQKGDKETKIVREFSPEEVMMTLTVDDILCTRLYKLVE